jgi:copper(I)-binding protein
MPKPATLMCVSVLAITAASSALAHDYKAGALKIGHPWTRATPNGASVGGGYLTVENTGPDADKLVGGTLAGAGRVEIHRMSMEGSVMKMAPVEGGLVITPNETVSLKPGGYHLMFLDLKGQLKKGEMLKGSLEFEKAGKVEVEFKVEAIAAKGPEGGHDHH